MIQYARKESVSRVYRRKQLLGDKKNSLPVLAGQAIAEYSLARERAENYQKITPKLKALSSGPLPATNNSFRS